MTLTTMIKMTEKKGTPMKTTHANLGRLGVLALALAVMILIPGGALRAQEAMETRLFDTGAPAAAALAPEALTKHAGWTQIPESPQKQPKFKGDVACTNGRLGLVLRRQGTGAELYTLGEKGAALRAQLLPVAGKTPAQKLSAVKIIENDAGGVVLEATYKTGPLGSLTVAYDLKAGQPFVQTQSRRQATGLRVQAPSRFVVLPDFFADDIVIDAAAIPAATAELPSDNFLMQMVPGAIVMSVWDKAQDDVRVTLAGEGKDRVISGSEIRYGKDGKVFVSVVEGSDIWHMREIGAGDGNKVLPLDWKAPFMAQWRVDWQTDRRLTDTWEMLTQKADGSYEKHGWYGQAEAFGNVDWLKTDRKRWTTVLGSFSYPCWLDKDGVGYLQPLAKKVRFQGPALIYPINRLESTPLDAFTTIDIMRATLGVGPCEYILDVEGQKKTFQGRPTCASRTILDAIYTANEQVAKRDEVLKTLDEVIAFVRHIRGRISDYVAFGHELDKYLEEQKTAHPELSGSLIELQDLVRGIDGRVTERTKGIRTPEEATGLVEEFRTSLVGYTGEGALARCKKITAALVGIGGNQDELVGECRVAVKLLRQRAATAMAADPRLAPIAREVRRRTQQMLRNPASYEAPRH